MAIIDVLQSLDLEGMDEANLNALRKILAKELAEVTLHREHLTDSINSIDGRLRDLNPDYKPAD
ncbi:MAG: hypothetical protein ACR2OL_12535 [Anderseniella sp.]